MGREDGWQIACLAQLVEHLPRKQKAKGSTPLTGFFIPGFLPNKRKNRKDGLLEDIKIRNQTYLVIYFSTKYFVYRNLAYFVWQPSKTIMYFSLALLS